MYNGQVEVAQGDIDDFLKASEELKVKGLSKQIDNILDGDISVDDEAHTPIALADFETGIICKEETSNILENVTYYENLNQEKEIVESIVDVKDIIASMIIKEYDYWKCTECDKTMPEKNNMKRHIETHVKGISLTCKLCQKTCRSHNSLSVHKSRLHKNS